MDNREKLEKQKQRMDKQRREDAALTKTLYWLVGAVLLEGLLFLIKRYLIDYELTEESVDLAILVSKVVGVAAVVGLLLAALFIVLAVLRHRKAGGNQALFWVLGTFFLGLGLMCALVWRYRADAVSLLLYLIPVIMVLALIYYLYQREFFSEALCSALGILGIWFVFRDSVRSPSTNMALIAVALLLLAVAVLTGVLQSKQGALPLKSGPVQILPKNANYVLIYISCAIGLAALAAALVLGGSINVMLYYAAPVAWVLVMAVYHTVKLM